MSLDEDLRLQVLLANVRNPNGFVISILAWSELPKFPMRWRIVRDMTSEIHVEQGEAIFVEGDWRGRLVAEHSTIVHVRGAVAGRIDLAAHSELVVAGEVRSEANLFLRGFADVFIGGDFHGTMIASRHALLAIIAGSAFGEVRLDCLNSRIRVGGLWGGAISRGDDAKMLSLEVSGFVPDARMRELASRGFLALNAAIGASDVPRGMYSNAADSRGARNKGFVHWIVQRHDPRVESSDA